VLVRVPAPVARRPYGCHHSFVITVLAVQIASSCFLVLVSLMAAAGFITYGGRLFLMLHRFPIESPGRLKKLREVLMPPVLVMCHTSPCSLPFCLGKVGSACSAYAASVWHACFHAHGNR
jgi:hypothetical protein